MRFDFLREPVSEDEPAGPDLDESFDTEYINITANASALIPERFYDRNREAVFDRSTIDLNVHEKAITRLLQRSRDIRLLVLDARLQILAGKLIGFSEALQGLVIVVTTFWDDFHPKEASDSEMIMRQNTLAGLDDAPVVIPALQSAPVLEGRSRISFRNYLVAFGKVEPWANEEPMARDAIERMLRPDERNETLTKETKAQLTASLEAVIAAVDALAAIRNSVVEKAGHLKAPSFDRLNDVLAAIRAFLEEYLGITSAAAAAAEEAELAAAAEEAGDDGGGAARPSGPVTSHAAAIAALKAAEDYFIRLEPSSPAMILVHQARLLIGRPLVEALEALLPEPAARAAMRFEGGFRFDLGLARMKLVTDDMLGSFPAPTDDPYASSSDSYSDNSYGSSEETVSEEPVANSSDEIPSEEDASADSPSSDSSDVQPSASSAPVPALINGAAATFSVANRNEASRLLNTVESFFRQVEPSSPVTVLLSRARAYIGKDFNAILSELMPPEPIG